MIVSLLTQRTTMMNRIYKQVVLWYTPKAQRETSDSGVMIVKKVS